MADNRYIVTHSNYTVKKKHKMLSDDSTVFERDYMVTSNLGGFEGGIMPYSNSNFKFTYNNEKSLKRKHKYGNWLKNENCVETSGETCDVFTLNNLGESDNEVSREGKIILKTGKNSLKDYVYYGSCVELIKNSIDDIILKFPGELYVQEYGLKYVDVDEFVSVGGDDMVLISNPYNIDIVSQSIPGKERNSVNYNPLRYFSESLNQYKIIDTYDNSYCITSWDVSIRDNPCLENGHVISTIKLNDGLEEEMLIKQYYYDGKFVLMTDKKHAGKRIRPTNGVINSFFDNINDFERLLLNRDTSPVYTITIDTPEENEYGVYYRLVNYSWPTIGGYNLDIDSSRFSAYYGDLLKIAEWYDENKTDNLWRNLTHESIKNMDRTYEDVSRNEDNEDYMIGTSTLRDVFYIIGRFFDDIKKSISVINSTTNVSYDENNNIPDYFLSDVLELSGWEVSNISEVLDRNVETCKLFNSLNKTYNSVDANTSFMRNLKINSRNIFSKKGTVNGIESLLSLFGYISYDWAKEYYNTLSDDKKLRDGNKSLSWDKLNEGQRITLYDYEINEYVVVASNKEDDVVLEDETLPVEVYNTYRLDYNSEFNTTQFYGLPIRMVTISSLDDVGEIIVKKYIIPWFDNTTYLTGEPYFQMYGGWGKSISKEVIPNNELYPDTKLIDSIDGFKIYDETKKYLNIIDTIESLKNIDSDDVVNGDIVYVNDISDIDEYFNTKVENPTNYFILEDKDNIGIIGSTTGGTGWKNIQLETLSSPVNDDEKEVAYKVIYLESIIEDNKGNNPHVGYGKYDDGSSYLEYFKHVFKGVIDKNEFNDDAYDCETGEILEEIKSCGFSVSENVIDNIKTWYFTDNTKENVYRLKEKTVIGVDDDYDEYEVKSGYEMNEYTLPVNVGKTAYSNNEVGSRTELLPFNFETQISGDNDEASANSIINVKKLTIKFNRKYLDNYYFERFFYHTVLPYLRQMIPSTTIVEYIIPKSYTVKFYDGLNLIESKRFVYGDMATCDVVPEKEGYNFIGWEPQLSEVKKNINYFAKFEKINE